MPYAGGIYYEVHGDAEAPALILSSGLGGSAHYWAPNIAALKAHYRVIAYDQRGTGRSLRELPDASVAAMATDVLQVMDSLGVQTASFVGHAFGGLVGLELADAHSHRLDKLVVVNGWAALDPHFERCFDVRLELLRKSGPAAYVRAQPIFLYPAEWISRHSAEIDAQEAAHVDDFPDVDVVERRIEALKSFWCMFIEIITPTLLIVAADDMLVPAHCSRALQDAMSADPPQLAVMKWGGHACNVTDPETFNKLVLDFLGS
jgi:aminoacrylate hydrolase